uniref:Sodium/potassium-transporting ATPase subunit beta n=1 Tax=Eptatretus burgeri TaxID=7764 RepID=A0A8C4X1R5_EPTBU
MSSQGRRASHHVRGSSSTPCIRINPQVDRQRDRSLCDKNWTGLIMTGHKKQQRIADLKIFLWNPNTKEFLGRTSNSWGKIILFYVILYAFLAGILMGTISVMLSTVPENFPKWRDRIPLPGLTMRPQVYKMQVAFDVSNSDSYKDYTQEIHNFLFPYNANNQTNNQVYIDCSENKPRFQSNIMHDTRKRTSCRFDLKWLGPCSGDSDLTYGYGNGKPCTILKINKIIEYIPISNEDKDSLGVVEYYGPFNRKGFPLVFYPYYGNKLHSGYLPPIVAVQFINAKQNVQIRVKCHLLHKDAEKSSASDRDRHLGRVELRLTVSNTSAVEGGRK